MTTHETQPEMMDATTRRDRPVEADAPLETVHPPENLDVREDAAETPAAPDSADQMLFGDSELSGLRSRWTEVQSTFVDDPRDCVQKADGLVADVVDKLTSGFSAARSRLEEQWDRGEEASTEDLRIALKRYREFFERLLAV